MTNVGGLTHNRINERYGIGQKDKDNKLLLDVFAIAGYQFYEGESVEHQLKSGDSLKLNAEPDNPHDEFAVEILTKNNAKLGHVPKNDNKALSRLLQKSTKVEANIEEMFYFLRISPCLILGA